MILILPRPVPPIAQVHAEIASLETGSPWTGATMQGKLRSVSDPQASGWIKGVYLNSR